VARRLYDQPVRVLTIDTATSAAAIGFVCDGVATDAAPIRDAAAAQHVLSAIDALLAAQGLVIADVDRIVVGRGPGSFTGQRIGLATAAGLAAPCATELVGVTTTSTLRHAAGPGAVAVIDARRGEVFAEGPGIELAACSAEELAARLPPGTLVVGDGAVRYRETFAACHVPPDESPLHVPSAAAAAVLAEQGEPATPVYVRAPDAVRTADR
jgi:tRNA threonylcarbamoyladenosine biosynthesis protein TsaB